MTLRSLEELVDTNEPAIELVRGWVSHADVDCEILPPSPDRADALVQTQVTTRSPMGAIVYETGGIVIDQGWLRLLGSGHPRLPRSLPEWNRNRSEGYLLVADDAVGGFFALNGGAFGDDHGSVYYWPPDDLEWEPLEMGYSDLLQACLSPRLAEFYRDLRWASWADDTRGLNGSDCFHFYPFLWTEEGSIETSHRRVVPVHEVFDAKLDILRHLSHDTT